MVIELTSANWDQEVTLSDLSFLVDFWAPWCWPCRLLAPIIERIADRFDARVKVGKLNIDENPEISGKYRIDTVPRVYLFTGGNQPREQLVGVQDEREIEEVLSRVLGA